MKLIGRKLYFNHGTNGIFAIEKLPSVKPSDVGMHDEVKAFTEGGVNSILYNVYDMDGVRMEQRVGSPSTDSLGYDVNGLFSINEFWATDEEFKKI